MLLMTPSRFLFMKNCEPIILYFDFCAAVDDIEVRSAPAARVDGEKIRSPVDWFVEDDFGKCRV